MLGVASPFFPKIRTFSRKPPENGNTAGVWKERWLKRIGNQSLEWYPRRKVLGANKEETYICAKPGANGPIPVAHDVLGPFFDRMLFCTQVWV